MSHETLFSFFYKSKTFQKKENGWETKYIKEDYLGSKLDHDIIDSNSGKVLAKSDEKFNVVNAKNIESHGLKNVFVEDNFLLGKYLSKDIYDENTGIIYFEAGDEISENVFPALVGSTILNIDT